MSRDEVEAWDDRKREELSNEIFLQDHCRRCPHKEPPTKERIEEVAAAVLHRRIQAARDELLRRRTR